MEKPITRRDFMKTTAGFAFGTAIGLKTEPQEKAAVVLIRDKNAQDANSKTDENIIQQMLDNAVMTLTGEDDPVKAFGRLIKPDDIVGIKSNVWFYLPTPGAMESAVERRVLDVGVKKEHVSIDDRGVRGNPVFKKATASSMSLFEELSFMNCGTPLTSQMAKPCTVGRYSLRSPR